jgi:hypothetical protein
MDTPSKVLNYIISKSELSDDDFENNECGIGFFPDTEEKINKINTFLQQYDQTQKLITPKFYLNNFKEEGGPQIIIKPDLTIYVLLEDEEFVLGEKYSRTIIRKLLQLIFDEKIDFGTINHFYLFKYNIKIF